jgi:hypothetical protein
MGLLVPKWPKLTRGEVTDCSWTHWSTKRSLRGNDIQEVMESMIDNTERIKHCKQVIPNKHLGHSCREEEVDRCFALRTGSREVEYQLAIFLLHCASNGKWSDALPIITDDICEGARLVSPL